MDRVLGIDELLELILLHLDTRNLLFAQGVSRRFRNLISASPRLQTALFFQPSKPSRAYDEAAGGYEPVLQNDLLFWAFGIFFIDLDEDDVPPGHAYSHWCYFEFQSEPWDKDERSRAAFSRSEASWRKMLVCDPPITQAMIVREKTGFCTPSTQRASLECVDGGLRMAELYDPVQYHVVQRGWAGNPASSFQVKWPFMKREDGRDPKPDPKRAGRRGLEVHVGVEYYCGTPPYPRHQGLRDSMYFRSEAAPEHVFLKWEPWDEVDDEEWARWTSERSHGTSRLLSSIRVLDPFGGT